MKKQIEEMAKDIIRAETEFGKTGKPVLDIEKYVAEHLYKQGYRKQVEGEWIDLHKGKYENPLYVCSACRKGAFLKIEADELNNPKTVQALTNYCPLRNFITLNSVTKDEIRKEYNEIFDKLKEYEDKQEWISVDERLPDDYTDVIVHTVDGIIDIDFYSFFTSVGKDFAKYCTYEITHWMPLPTPPKMKGAE